MITLWQLFLVGLLIFFLGQTVFCAQHLYYIYRERRERTEAKRAAYKDWWGGK